MNILWTALILVISLNGNVRNFVGENSYSSESICYENIKTNGRPQIEQRLKSDPRYLNYRIYKEVCIPWEISVGDAI